MLFKSSHYWKVISKEKSQPPQQGLVKGRGREESIKRRHQRGRYERRTQEGVGAEEGGKGGADLSVLSLNWLEMYREQKTNSTSRDFSDNPSSHKHSPPHTHTHTQGEVRSLFCPTFKEMSPWDFFFLKCQTA